MFLALLGGVVVGFAERDEVIGVEEEARVTAMRPGVVDDRREGRAAHGAAKPAVRFAAELVRSQCPPLARAVPLAILRGLRRARVAQILRAVTRITQPLSISWQ